jgi:hypothetical protein
MNSAREAADSRPGGADNVRGAAGRRGQRATQDRRQRRHQNLELELELELELGLELGLGLGLDMVLALALALGPATDLCRPGCAAVKVSQNVTLGPAHGFRKFSPDVSTVESAAQARPGRRRAAPGHALCLKFYLYRGQTMGRRKIRAIHPSPSGRLCALYF